MTPVNTQPTITPQTERRILWFILAACCGLATLYSVVTPIFEASDELWHYPMVQYIATSGQLPVQNPAQIGPWRQEGSQPPLYYMLAAALTAGIDTSDMNLVRRQNPHADIGVVLPDRNVNMITHRTDLEAFPWHGTTLAVHIARFFSILLGLGTVVVTYLLAREIFPDEPTIRLGAAALAAFLPMFLFISGSVNNDNLSNLAGNLLLLLTVRLATRAGNPRLRDYVLLGVVTGAGLLAKFNIGFMIPLIVVTLIVVSFRQRDWRPLVIGGGVSGALTILIAGWWYVRNQQLYGDPTGLNVFLDIVGRRLVPANAAQLWSERHSFTQSFWGFFGGMNVPLPDAIYLIFNVIGGLSLLSAAGYGVYRLLRRQTTRLQARGWFPISLTLLWLVISFISYLRWTAETPASQGRLMFGALSAITLWTAVGMVWWLPSRLRPALTGSIGLALGAVALCIPFGVIAPAYQEPDVSDVESQAVALATFSHGDTGSVDLLSAGVQLQSVEVMPEDYVILDTVWRIDQPFDRDWSLFVHLVTPDGVILSQRDVYPAQGLLATSDLPAGRIWRSPIAVRIPPAAYAPMTLDVNIGWYDLVTGQRLKQANGLEVFHIGQVHLLPRASELDVPNPISINFGDLAELMGYEISDLSPAAGDTVDLTLYWRGLRKIDHDYKVFADIIDPSSLMKYASSDAMPANWNAPTSTWQPGEIIADTHSLQIAADALPGIYELQIGLYRETSEGFSRLRVYTPDGGQANDFAYLSRVRIVPAGQESGE